MSEPTILQEAHDLIFGDRQEDYGKPGECLGRIADIWNAQLNKKLRENLTGHDVALLMAGLKLARAAHRYKRDSLVDAAGYLALADMTADKG